MYDPLRCTASVIFFQPFTCSAFHNPGALGHSDLKNERHRKDPISVPSLDTDWDGRNIPLWRNKNTLSDNKPRTAFSTLDIILEVKLVGDIRRDRTRSCEGGHYDSVRNDYRPERQWFEKRGDVGSGCG